MRQQCKGVVGNNIWILLEISPSLSSGEKNWKSVVKIWLSYHHEFSGTPFLEHGVESLQPAVAVASAYVVDTRWPATTTTELVSNTRRIYNDILVHTH